MRKARFDSKLGYKNIWKQSSQIATAKLIMGEERSKNNFQSKIDNQPVEKLNNWYLGKFLKMPSQYFTPTDLFEKPFKKLFSSIADSPNSFQNHTKQPFKKDTTIGEQQKVRISLFIQWKLPYIVRNCPFLAALLYRHFQII